MGSATKTNPETRFEENLTAELDTLKRFALKRTRNVAQAEDLVQETMLRALKYRDRFKPGTNFRAWLFTILKNTHLNEVRKNKKTCEYLDAVDMSHDTAALRQDSHMELLDMSRYMTMLPPGQRETLMVHTFASASYQETARRCNCTLGTVRSRLSRARSQLREYMQSGAPHAGRNAAMPLTARLAESWPTSEAA